MSKPVATNASWAEVDIFRTASSGLRRVANTEHCKSPKAAAGICKLHFGYSNNILSLFLNNSVYFFGFTKLKVLHVYFCNESYFVSVVRPLDLA